MKFCSKFKQYKYNKYSINYKKIKKIIKLKDFTKAKKLIINETKKTEKFFNLMKYLFWFSIEEQILFSDTNQECLRKIIKKYNKKSRECFQLDYIPSFINSYHLVNIKASLITNKQEYDEYMNCPICADLTKIPAYLPCSHIFCNSCLVKLHNNNMNFCPICRTQYKNIFKESKILTYWNILFNLYYIYNKQNKTISERTELDNVHMYLLTKQHF
jgi:hypothetical protein